MESYTLQQAIDLMKQGNKMTHGYFSREEWVTYDCGLVKTEEGYLFSPEDFWNDKGVQEQYRRVTFMYEGWTYWEEITYAPPFPGVYIEINNTPKQPSISIVGGAGHPTVEEVQRSLLESSLHTVGHSPIEIVDRWDAQHDPLEAIDTMAERIRNDLGIIANRCIVSPIVIFKFAMDDRIEAAMWKGKRGRRTFRSRGHQTRPFLWLDNEPKLKSSKN